MAHATATTDKKRATYIRRTYTLLEYLEREERTKHKHEFYNRTLSRLPGSKYNHNQITANTIHSLNVALNGLSKEYRVFNSDQKILIEEKNIVFYPDALVICEKPKFWQGRTDVLLNPILIVEVASKTIRNYDRGEKFMHYQRIPSFKEYVLIEQDLYHAESWFRQDKETWKTSKSSDLNGSIKLRSLGVELALKDVYRFVEF